ncbi:response regulator [Candidatus Kryptonium thompsonii]|uniref:response regulator n=1 Tax=Candidatus Kryptonium thompsonii TaxID=1633631 RepID=UPI000707260C|nr:response regulator [Candidatus Kryptonium thompsoni]CUS84069.1 Response regulator receiver domain-containing protein [Candidatus Kryptonium thompsoni]
MNGKTIAIIEDDKDILELIALHVQKAGFKPKKFTDGESFFRYLSTDMPDVLILDLMLPDMDGLEICKVLRSNPSTAKLPIIILTAKIEETDKIVGLELGADDYITKPFSPRELIARVKAVLRRTSEEETTEEEILKVGDKNSDRCKQNGGVC